MDINFQGFFTIDELTQAYVYHYLPSKFSKLIRVLIACLTIVLFSLYFFFVYPHGLLSMVGFIFPLILIFMVVFLPFYLPRRNAKNLLRDTEFRYPISGSITDRGVLINTQNSNSEISWGLYLNFIQVDDMLLLYQSKRTFNIFPKRFFQNDEDWGTFNNYVRNNVDMRKIGLGLRSS